MHRPRGRGAFFRAKYGGGNRGRGSGNHDLNRTSNAGGPQGSTSTRSWQDLSKQLLALDNAPYGAYNQLRDVSYCHPSFTLRVDRVQGDPFAPPSRVSAAVPLEVAGFPTRYTQDEASCIALRDYLSRLAAAAIRNHDMDVGMGGKGWGGPKGGAFNIDAPGQEVLNRTSCVLGSGSNTLELRLTISLPARGRSILGQAAESVIVHGLPELVKKAMLMESCDADDLELHIQTVKRQIEMRSLLAKYDLTAFVADGSILPRRSGANALPMTGSGIVPTTTPPEHQWTLNLANGETVTGMGIRRGVTVLTGGGFHGKSTLLEAIQMGVYNHVPGDGREGVVTDATAVKVRAEDGRSVSGVDISPMISVLPGGRTCEAFYTEDASGSTSMAASIQEAIELGSKLLLIDEDTSANNLLVRDERMQLLIKSEPITPLVSKVRALHAQHEVSTVIVVGGSGDWLDAADSVIGMDNYKAHDLTAESKRIVLDMPRNIMQAPQYGELARRTISIPSATSGGRAPSNKGKTFIKIFSDAQRVAINPAMDEDGIDLSDMEQLVEPGQASLAGEALKVIAQSGKRLSMSDMMDWLEHRVSEGGLDALESGGEIRGNMVETRRQELGAVVNRLRGLEVDRAL